MIKLDKVSYKIEDNSFIKNTSETILKDISMEIMEGDLVGIVGESGAGKTTIAKIIANLIKPTTGEITYNSVNKNAIQILFQNSIELINPSRSIESIFNDVLKVNGSDIIEAIKKVNLEKSILNKYGYQLSGGERQRIALARILMISPKVLILDEPFSAQDTKAQTELVKLFTKLNKEEKVTIFCTSHDLNIMSSFPNKLGVMHNGKLVELGETNSVFENPKSRYTKFLFEARDYNLTKNDFQNRFD